MSERLLLINQYYPPDRSATADLARELVESWRRGGGAVTVLTGRPSYDTDEHGPWRLWTTADIDGVRVITLGSTGFDRARQTGRVANYVSFALLVAIATVIERWRGRPRIVFMTDPPFLPLVIGPLAGRRSAAWIQDLHPDFSVAAGLMPEGVVVRAWRQALRLALRRTGRVVVLGRDMRDRILSFDVPAERIVLACNGYPAGSDPESRCPAPPDRGDDQPLRVLHLGNLGYAVPWETLIGAADGLVDVAELVLVGTGAREEWLRSQAATRGNVTLHGRVPREEVGALARDADLLLVAVGDAIEGTMVPSKTYELLAMGRPLLVVAHGHSEPALLVTETGSGIVASPSDPEAVVKAVTSASRDREALHAMGVRAWQAAHGLSRHEQVDKLRDALRRL